ncbi:carboxymuconolactone decarboxylase family protein [Bdellovibrio sp. SKB1291214]|uniref:carboxymuconolactone decarboxylase family protein n=1 Tax=Bdellovibrio sp. SKB1291214 TaxID=1732569 RepID=UPI0022409040|nr:carboxymuconolactone decarboxylase family protein [Bdellovibrio sp. SKB1291214]UYL10712.1 carboxymuconolactone decarboxylase family protein [Bdellovibrio sp. SKB1291214]
MKILLPLMAPLLFFFVAFAAQKPETVVSQNPQAQAAYEEIRATFGTIPTFMKEFPQEGISGAWQEFRDIQLNPTTALTPKTKELIGLAVAAQIPCTYCVYFHKRAAKFNGATDQELNYALAIAADTRKWATFWEGSPIPFPKFKMDVDKMISSFKNKKPGAVTEHQSEPLIGDANGAYKDMQNMLGVTPAFVKPYAAKGIAGAWNEHKMLSMNPKSPLAPATIDLISLAVSAQTPCQYCVYIYSEFAKLHQATEEQMRETVAMAGLTRHWSTFLNGMQQPQKEFEREVDQIFNRMEEKKNQMNKQISSK